MRDIQCREVRDRRPLQEFVSFLLDRLRRKKHCNYYNPLSYCYLLIEIKAYFNFLLLFILLLPCCKSRLMHEVSLDCARGAQTKNGRSVDHYGP